MTLFTQFTPFRPKKSTLLFLVSARVASDPRVGIFNFLLFFVLWNMSNCSQNCWIYGNSAMLCFKRLFHIGVWTFARFVSPLLATIWKIWSPRTPLYMWGPNVPCTKYFPYITFFPVWSRPMTRNRRLFFFFFFNFFFFWVGLICCEIIYQPTPTPIDEFQIEQVRALPHWNRGSLCQVTTLMRGRQ